MKNIKWGFFILFITFAYVAWTWTVEAKTKPSDVAILHETMRDAGFEPQWVQLHLGQPIRTIDQATELRDLALQMAKDLSLPLPHFTTNTDTQWGFQATVQQVQTDFMFSAVPDNQGKWVGYITIRLTTEASNLEALQTLEPQWKQILQKYHILPQFNSCVMGKRDGKLDIGVQSDAISHVLTKLDAKRIESAQDRAVISVSAYTDVFSQSILTNGKKMSLQIGTHVDEVNHLTRMTIGTPIITTEY